MTLAFALLAAVFTISAERMPKIVVEPGVRPFVTRAADDLAGDLEKIFGVRPSVTSEPRAADAIVLAKGGAGYENYSLESREGNVLRITGSDDRGIMFGVYRFAKDFLGVDPFFFWLDRPPVRQARLSWDSIDLHQGDPTFRFRGWFVNDGDSLSAVCPETAGRRHIDYERYQVVFGSNVAERVCEAAVRCGMNTIIPSSYVDILNPDERKLVDVAVSRGLILTMHHQEPCGVSGWIVKRTWTAQGRGHVSYAEDPEFYHGIWRKYVKEWAKVPDVIWQIGLRGVGDRPFWIKADWHSAEGWVTEEAPEAVARERAKLMSRAMHKQLEIITEELGHRPEHYATQLWLEGTDFFRKGYLDVPEGTCVIYSDNSPGLKFGPDVGSRTDLPQPAGAYYHLGIVHGNYYTQLVHPRRTQEVMRDIYAKGAHEIALVNTANIRPHAFTLTAFGEMTRDLDGFDPDAYVRRWADARGGGEPLARAVESYFGSFLTVPSRDATSSYGAKGERAPLALFNDGILYARTDDRLAEMEGRRPEVPSDVPTDDPQALTDIQADAWCTATQDMYPYLKSRLRSVELAFAQAEKFDLVVSAFAPYGTEFLYQSKFIREALRLYATTAMGDLDAALLHAERRDALDAEMCRGWWRHWHDLHTVFPYRRLAPRIRKLLENPAGRVFGPVKFDKRKGVLPR